MTYRRSLGLLLGMILVGWLIGCGGAGVGPQPKSGDEGEIQNLATDIQDFARSRDTFEPLFVEGKVPSDSDRRKYYNYLAFYVKEGIKIEGDRATIPMEILDPESEAEEGTKVNWTAVKVDGKWKLDEAPIPDSLKK